MSWLVCCSLKWSCLSYAVDISPLHLTSNEWLKVIPRGSCCPRSVPFVYQLVCVLLHAYLGPTHKGFVPNCDNSGSSTVISARRGGFGWSGAPVCTTFYWSWLVWCCPWGVHNCSPSLRHCSFTPDRFQMVRMKHGMWRWCTGVCS